MAICQLCNTAESRYKCPTCLIPYCSLACYKPHKATHDAESTNTAEPNTATSSASVPVTGADDNNNNKTDTLAGQTTSPTPVSIPDPAPALEPSSTPAPAPAPALAPPTQPTTTISRYTPLLKNPHILPLIYKTPSLHSLLYQIYLSTLEPPPPPPPPPSSSSTAHPAKNPFKIRKNNHKQQSWTREIGINKGVKRLGKIREKGLAKGGDGGMVEEVVGLIVGCLGGREGEGAGTGVDGGVSGEGNGVGV